MKSYPSYDALAVDLDLHFFDKISILSQIGDRLEDGSWLVITDDGHFHLFDKDGNLDDITKIRTLYGNYIRRDIKKIIIPDSVTQISDCAFFNCNSLTNVTLSNNLKCISHGIFAYCSSLVDVKIPNSATSIEKEAFLVCRSLISIEIPNSVTSIGTYAFYYCNSLTHITIPDSVTKINGSAFFRCNNLKKLLFKGKTINQVRKMRFYPWKIQNTNIICVE